MDKESAIEASEVNAGSWWLRFAVVLSLLAAGAAGGSGFDRIRVQPLSRNSSRAAQTRGSEPAGQLGEAIATRLRQHLAKTPASARRPAAAGALTVEQREALAHLQQRVQAAVEVRLRPGVGTPLQIRGAALEPASTGADADLGTALNFLRLNRALLRLQDPDRELVLQRRETDALGRRHLRYSQIYQGLPVWPAELIVHLDPAGNVDLMDGAFVPTPADVGVEPALDADAATTRARAAVQGGGQARVTAPQLIIYAPGDHPTRLGWKLDLDVSLAAHWVVVIDALDGSTLTAFNQVAESNVHGSGVDLFGQTPALNVWSDNAGNFFMVDTTKQMFDSSSTPPSPATTRGAIIVQDAQNEPPGDPFQSSFPQVFDVTSNNPNSGWLPDAVSAVTSLGDVYDYYLQRHGRNSIDGQGGTILAVVRMGQNFDNAFWSSALNLMVFGDAHPWARALDVVGHELTHGVTSYTANLIYQDQPGALNEAMSDIFGESIEAFERSGQPDWLEGEDAIALRSFSDPEQFGQPSKMSAFVVTTQDNGGVHTNSGIVNHAYYLLAQGMDGAIGIPDAERIFYRALTTHLVSNSRFIDARLACVTSAQELFGQTSMQATQTGAAFDAVEIFQGRGTPQPSPFPPVNGTDALLFLFYDNMAQSYFLGRREAGLGDTTDGVQLSDGGAAQARASVVGDGSQAVFVNDRNDVCFINTDGTQFVPSIPTREDCLGFPGFINSVAVAPGGERFGFVLLDAQGNPENKIQIIDTGAGGHTQTFTLQAPALDGGLTDTVLNADIMDFTADGGTIIYDALNRLRVSDGSEVLLWSIYSLNIATGVTQTLVPPTQGFDIGDPALSQTSDNFIVFDATDQQSGQSTVFAANLTTGERKAVATVSNGLGVPGYTGDDSAVVYSQTDDSTPTGFSLMRQPLAADRMTPSGAPAALLTNADFGVIYRRGTFVGPNPCTGDCNSDGAVTVDEILTMVNIALGNAQVSSCVPGDGNVDGVITVDEILAAVNAALNGCAAA